MIKYSRKKGLHCLGGYALKRIKLKEFNRFVCRQGGYFFLCKAITTVATCKIITVKVNNISIVTNCSILHPSIQRAEIVTAYRLAV